PRGCAAYLQLSLDPLPNLPASFACDAFGWSPSPASRAVAPFFASAMPARYGNLAQRLTRRAYRGTAFVWPVNPDARLYFIAPRRTCGGTVPQNFENLGLGVSHAGEQVLVQHAPRFQTKGVAINGDVHATPLQFAQNLSRSGHTVTSSSS